MAMDHKALLMKYMARVIDSESVDYIEYPVGCNVDFTDEEKAELTKLSGEANAMLNACLYKK